MFYDRCERYMTYLPLTMPKFCANIKKREEITRCVQVNDKNKILNILF